MIEQNQLVPKLLQIHHTQLVRYSLRAIYCCVGTNPACIIIGREAWLDWV